MFAEEEKE